MGVSQVLMSRLQLQATTVTAQEKEQLEHKGSFDCNILGSVIHVNKVCLIMSICLDIHQI